MSHSIQSGYDRWASIYDHDANPLQALEEPVVRESIGDVTTLSVLDLGCGTGRHSIWLADAGAKVTAIDFSEGMLREAKHKASARTIRFLQFDLHQGIPFESEFDRVVSGLVLEHIIDLGHFFSEIRKCLKPKGRAVISAMHPAMFLRGTQARFTDPQTGELIQPGSFAHTISEMVMASIQHGFFIKNLIEKSPSEEFSRRYPRASKYVEWPMLVVMSLEAN